MIIGLISGAMGPFSNAPIDTIKTRKSYIRPSPPPLLPPFIILKLSLSTGLQKAPADPGKSAFQRILVIAQDMWRQEGVRSFYKGITPRVLRVAPGQAIVFAVYERVRKIIDQIQPRDDSDVYTE